VSNRRGPETRDEEMDRLRQDYASMLDEVRSYRDRAATADRLRESSEVTLERVQYDLKKSKWKIQGLERKESVLNGVVAELTLQNKTLNEELDKCQPGRRKVPVGSRRLNLGLGGDR